MRVFAPEGDRLLRVLVKALDPPPAGGRYQGVFRAIVEDAGPTEMWQWVCPHSSISQLRGSTLPKSVPYARPRAHQGSRR